MRSLKLAKKRTENDIFGGGPGLPGAAQPRNVMKDDFGLDIPTESVPLPSLGSVYPPDSPLYAKETLDIRPMTAREEDILTSRALIKKGTVITKLIESCLTDKSVNVKEMLSGDRNAVMVALRITGYGSDYTTEVECPSCATKTKFEFNLSDLPISRLTIPPAESGKNLFSFTLPFTKKVVNFRFLTGADEEEINTQSERRRKLGNQSDNLVTSKLLYSIVDINGVTDRNKIASFVRNMPARDSRALRKFIDDNEPGVDMKAWFDCAACGEATHMSMPLGASFFWPDI